MFCTQNSSKGCLYLDGVKEDALQRKLQADFFVCFFHFKLSNFLVGRELMAILLGIFLSDMLIHHSLMECSGFQ
jgi:hypothetical protein